MLNKEVPKPCINVTVSIATGGGGGGGREGVG